MKQKHLNKKMSVRKVTIANLESLKLNAVKGGTDLSLVVGVACYPVAGTDNLGCSYYPVRCRPGFEDTIDPCS